MSGIPAIALGDEARERLRRGAANLARCVRHTLGPQGGSTLVARAYADPQASRDGLFVAQRMQCEDPIANLGLKMLRQAAQQTSLEAGDGATTSMVMTARLLEAGWEAVSSGMDARMLSRFVKREWKHIDAEILRQADPFREDEAWGIAHRACDDPDLADIVMTAAREAGETGAVRVVPDEGVSETIEIARGMSFPARLLSSAFLTDPERMRVELDDALVLICDGDVRSLDALVPALERVLDTGRPFILVAQEVSGEALASLALNAAKGVMRGIAIEAPGFGKRRSGFLQDLACFVGGEVISSQKGQCLGNTTLDQMGRVRRLAADTRTVTFEGGAGDRDALTRHVARLEREIEVEDSEFDREKLEERRARLHGSIALVKVGGRTEAHREERLARARNALAALQSARKEGLLSGGGVALARLAAGEGFGESVEDRAARTCLDRALCAPLETIAHNAGLDPGWVRHRIRSAPAGTGWDARTGEIGSGLGPRDPVFVLRTALKNAVGCACTLLETGCAVAHPPHEEETELL